MHNQKTIHVDNTSQLLFSIHTFFSFPTFKIAKEKCKPLYLNAISNNKAIEIVFCINNVKKMWTSPLQTLYNTVHVFVTNSDLYITVFPIYFVQFLLNVKVPDLLNHPVLAINSMKKYLECSYRYGYFLYYNCKKWQRYSVKTNNK